VTLKGQGHDPDMFGANYHENGWRYTLDSNVPLIGNDPLGFECSRDVISHVTHDPDIFGAHYLEND